MGSQGSSHPLSRKHTGLQTGRLIFTKPVGRSGGRALAEDFTKLISLPLAAAPPGRCCNHAPSTVCVGGF